jgi:hypothetical protein
LVMRMAEAGDGLLARFDFVLDTRSCGVETARFLEVSDARAR